MVNRSVVLIISIAVIAVIAGCVGQTPAAGGGPAISFSASVEPSQIRTDEIASLFVDVENVGSADLPKVFIEAFDTGPLATQRAVGQPSAGTLPIKAGTRDIEIGGNISKIVTSISCTRSADCADEEFGGCGSCEVQLGTTIGQCLPSARSGTEGARCEKQCECSQGYTCKYDSSVGSSYCTFAGRCADGAPANSCSGIGEYCTPWGETVRACGGFDGFQDDVWGESPVAPSPSDDCGCPGNFVCRGDGTCADPVGCYVTLYGLRKGETQTLECNLAVAQPSSLIQATTPVSIAVRADFRARLAGSLTLDVLSRDEWRRRQTIGNLVAKPQSYTFSDGNIQAVLDFGSQPPFVSGDRTIASLSIRSTGDGSVLKLQPSDVAISQPGSALQCSLEAPLRSERGVFPPITCTLDAPAVDTAATYPITLSLYYDYEIRRTVPVSILKT